MIRRALAAQPGLCEEPDAATWSDLHLGDLGSVTAFDRPFRTAHEMDQAMMDAWYELVGLDDTIHLLGRRKRSTEACWRTTGDGGGRRPARSGSCSGNHDVDPVN